MCVFKIKFVTSVGLKKGGYKPAVLRYLFSSHSLLTYNKMRASLLAFGLCCLAGCVFSNALPSEVGFDEFSALRSGDDNGENDEIVGGTAAKPGEFPYLAGLYLDGSLCGGSLISPNVILTAAHCLSGKTQSSVSNFTAILNSTSLNRQPGAVTKTISKFIVHPKYNSKTQDNDVALLILSSPAKGLKTIALPPAGSKETYAGKTATIAGYGTTSSSDAKRWCVCAGWFCVCKDRGLSPKLLKANVKVLTNTACSKQYNNINNNKICAAAPGKDTCQGDSGGPMVVNGVLVGVTSYGKGCADPKYAGVYARVTTYVSWIKSNNKEFDLE